jgi:hypothetical protein
LWQMSRRRVFSKLKFLISWKWRNFFL